MEIKIEVAGARLDKALADLTPLSRAVANEQIKEGKVLVNGAVKKAKANILNEGLHIPDSQTTCYHLQATKQSDNEISQI